MVSMLLGRAGSDGSTYSLSLRLVGLWAALFLIFCLILLGFTMIYVSVPPFVPPFAVRVSIGIHRP